MADKQYDYDIYHDTHQLNGQRMYNVVCFMYGSNPEMFSEWRDTEWLPEDRAQYCTQEYDHAVRAWEHLLKPYFIYDYGQLS